MFDPFKKAFNYDVTVEAPGHTLYSESANQILEKIQYSSNSYQSSEFSSYSTYSSKQDDLYDTVIIKS